MEYKDQLNPSWTTDVRTTWTTDVRTIWVWEILYRCQQPVT